MEKRWWQEAVIYELYCKSFYDTNGDGLGDLPGVIEKLPYLKELGIDAIWFTPIYVSPQVDNGYDVADYQMIDPRYGSMDDFKRLLDTAHSMGIRVLMDLVLNHTSDEHKWFQESKKSKNNPYRDYYIWRAPKEDGSEPNNMGNYFFEDRGSAWEFDETTGEYYLHYYSKKMPDLNWECEALREDVYKMTRFWLDMGVDGFRLDVIAQIKKPEGLPDETKAPLPNGYVMDRMARNHVPGVHELIHGLWENAFSKYDIMTVGEISGATPKLALQYVNHDRGELDMNIHFQIANRNAHVTTPREYKAIETEWSTLMQHNGWVVQYLTNHDGARQVSRFGNDTTYRKESAKLWATLNLTTPGTPILFQGEEIGMTNVQYDTIDDYNDRYTVGRYHMEVKAGADPEKTLKEIAPASRDNARTPYQWTDEANAGFSTGTPWLKVNKNFPEINLKKDLESPDSIFRYYKEMLAFRKKHPSIVDGAFKTFLNDDETSIIFTRACARETLLIVANTSDECRTFEFPEELSGSMWKKVMGNYGTYSEKQEVPTESKLYTDFKPWEVAIFSLTI